MKAKLKPEKKKESNTDWYYVVLRDSKPKVDSGSMPAWGWNDKAQLDKLTHLEKCAHCRSPRKPKQDERLYGVKHRKTRAYIHMIAFSLEEAAERIGWLAEDCWGTVLEDGDAHSKPMSEETKARLREINSRRRSGSGPRPTRTNPRHSHACPDCGTEFFHTDAKCEPTRVVQCIECEPEKGGIDTGTPAWFNDDMDQDTNDSNSKKGGEPDMADSLKEFVASFIEAQVVDKGEDGKPELNEKKLFDLAKANDIDAGKYRKDFKENPGRIRMTIGNMIRGAASRNGKLITLGGASKTVPSNLLPPKKEKPAPKAKADKKEKAA